jgi:hypothetical protein
MTDHQEITFAKRPRRSGARRAWRAPVRVLLSGVFALKGVIAAAAVLGGGYALSQSYGMPAVHYAYDYRGGGYGQPRYKTACRYLSPYGVHERHATGGQCPWVVLARTVAD